MGTDKVGTILNVVVTAAIIAASLIMLHNGVAVGGVFGILVSLVWVQLTADEYQEATDPLSDYAPGGAKFKATPWNTERVADPSQPKPWWVESA